MDRSDEYIDLLFGDDPPSWDKWLDYYRRGTLEELKRDWIEWHECLKNDPHCDECSNFARELLRVIQYAIYEKIQDVVVSVPAEIISRIQLTLEKSGV